MKTTRACKGHYIANINGHKIDIEHGCEGWYIAPYFGDDVILQNVLDWMSDNYSTKKELLISLEGSITNEKETI